MKKLSPITLLRIDKYMDTKARPLEKALYNYYIHHEGVINIIEPLKGYQNLDGGFGNGIEPDFWLKESSPMATTIGLKYLRLVEHLDEGKEMIEKAIGYLEATYNMDRRGWLSVPKSVNDYPHAPWWHYDENIKRTVIDESWGNPSSELIGYLYRYKKYVKCLNIDQLVDFAIYHYNNESQLDSEHEVYCYIRLYNNLDESLQKKLEKKIEHAIEKLIAPDKVKWTTYVPMPLNFVEVDSENLFNIKVHDMNVNLEHFIDALEASGRIEPLWCWTMYPDSWTEAKVQWTGILTLDAMLKLQKFDRL